MTETHSGSAVDLLVIGGGSAGIVAAKTAARFGADVLLVERDRMGGDCLWTGCVPSKSLIAAADAATRARSSVELGVSASSVNVSLCTGYSEWSLRGLGSAAVRSPGLTSPRRPSPATTAAG